MIRSVLTLLVLCLSLIGCGSVPPTPVDRFYRLQPVALSALVPSKAFPAGLAIQPFRADSLYAERPLVYSEDANSRQLRQYHYHLWLYAPAQLVQDHLLASFGKAADRSGKETGPRLEGRILRFDRVLAGKNSTAIVMLELRLRNGAKVLLNKTYQAEQAAADDSVGAHVVAIEQALAAIYRQFLQDAGS